MSSNETFQNLLRTVKTLWVIFAGALLFNVGEGIKLTAHGQAWILHLPSAMVGEAIISVGIWRLLRYDLGGDCRRLLQFVLAAALAGVAAGIAEQFPLPKDPAIELGKLCMGLVNIAAAVSFPLAMLWLCQDMSRPWLTRGWRRTILLVISCYAVPSGLFDVVSILALVEQTRFDPAPGWLGLLPSLMVVPLASSVFAIRRMGRECESLIEDY